MRYNEPNWKESPSMSDNHNQMEQTSSHEALSMLNILLIKSAWLWPAKYTLKSEPKALTGDKSEGIKSRGAAEAFIRGFSPVKAEGEEFNLLILSYTRELSRPFKENKG